MITICFENRVAEHVRASQLYYQTTFFAIGDKIAAGVLCLTGIGSTLAIGLHWWTAIFVVLAPVLWFNLLTRLRAYQIFRVNPKYREAYVLTFDTEGIGFKTHSIDSSLKWSFYQGILEDTELFLLVSGRWQYAVLPKRAFADAAEQDAFRTLAQQMIAPAG